MTYPMRLGALAAAWLLVATTAGAQDFRDRINGILDFRVDKSFPAGRSRITAMLDVFNASNSCVVTAFRQTTANYQEVTGILDPRVVRVALKVNF